MGGAIGGVCGFAAFTVIGVWLWKRNHKQHVDTAFHAVQQEHVYDHTSLNNRPGLHIAGQNESSRVSNDLNMARETDGPLEADSSIPSHSSAVDHGNVASHRTDSEQTSELQGLRNEVLHLRRVLNYFQEENVNFDPPPTYHSETHSARQQVNA